MQSPLFGYEDPGQHAWMILDEVRTAAFARAIEVVVHPGDVVLDIGSGSGLLAVLAARAGAAKIYAVEETAAVELVDRHARENGVRDRLQIIRADVAELTRQHVPEPPRVIMGEVLGTLAPQENQHRLFALARRLARPDAVTIPRSYRLVFSAARPRSLERDQERLQSIEGVQLRTLASLLRSRVAIARLSPDDLAGPEAEGESIAIDGTLPRSFGGAVSVDRDGPVTAIAVAFRAELADGISLTTAVSAPKVHWAQALFPLDPPLVCRSGDRLDVELNPRLVTRRNTWAWRVRRGHDVREGDAMRSFIGDEHSLLAQLDLRVRPVGRVKPTTRLAAWSTILGAHADGVTDVDDLATALLDRMPDAFADLEDARQEVMRMLDAAGALE